MNKTEEEESPCIRTENLFVLSNNFYIFSVYVDCVSLYCTELSAKAEMTNQAAQKNYDVTH